MQGNGGFDGGLRVELGGERNFEKNVLHNVAAETLRGHPERFALEKNVLKAPGFCRDCAGITHLALQGKQRVPHGTARRIPGCPALA